MVVDEIMVMIRASAEGVKRAVDVAKKELGKLEALGKHLDGKLKLTAELQGVRTLLEELNALIKKKKALEEKITIPVEARAIAEINQELEEAKAKVAQLHEDAMKSFDNISFDGLYEGYLKAFDMHNQLQQELQKSIQLHYESNGQEVVDELVTMEGLIHTAQQVIQLEVEASGVEGAAAQLISVNGELMTLEQGALKAAEAFKGIAEVGAKAFKGMVEAIKDGMEAYTSHTAALEGLKTAVYDTGESFTEAQGHLADFTKDGLVSTGDAAAALNNLLSKGFSLDQSILMMNRFKDAAAFGRSSTLSMGEAVKAAAEGINKESTALLNNAGITKSAADMWRSYAQSIGKSAEDLTEAEKRQAVFNGILADTESALGNSEKMADTLAGAQTRATNATEALSAAFGESLAPLLTLLHKALAVLAEGLTGLITNFKPLVAAFTTFGAVAAGLTIVINGLTNASKLLKQAKDFLQISLKATTADTYQLAGAMGALQAMSGPLVIGLGAVIGVLTGIYTGYKTATGEAEEFAVNAERLKELLENGLTDEDEEFFKKQVENLKTLKEDLDKFIETYNTEFSNLSPVDEKLFDHRSNKALEEYTEKLKEAGIEFEEATELADEMRNMIEAVNQKFLEATEVNEAYLRKKREEAELHKNLVTDMNAIKRETDDYNKKMKLLIDSQEQLNNTHTISEDLLMDLIVYFPQVSQVVMAHDNYLEHLGGTIEGLIDDMPEITQEYEDAQLEMLSKAIENSNKRINQIDIELQAYADLAGGMDAIADTDFFKNSQAEIEKNRELQKTLEDLIAARKAARALRDNPPGPPESDDSGSDDPPGNCKGLGSAKQRQEVEEEINQELKDRLAAYEKEIRLQEYSAAQRIEMLEEIMAMAAKTQEETEDIQIMIHPLILERDSQEYQRRLKEITDNIYKDADNVDFAGLQAYISETIAWVEGAYQGHGETKQRLIDELTQYEVSAAEKRADKLAALAERQADETISQFQKVIDMGKAMNGIDYMDDNGQRVTYSFTLADEIEQMQLIVAALDEEIDALMAKQDTLTEKERDYLEKRLEQRQEHNISLMKLITKQQGEEEKAAEDHSKTMLAALEKVHKEVIAKEKEKNQQLIEEIKNRYSAEIQWAEEAAAAEIAVYEEKINAIDALLGESERANQDEVYRDKLKRLQEQLKYELDEGNRYELQKEINNLQSDYEKRKHKENLEEQKAALKDEMDQVKKGLAERKQLLTEQRDAETAIQQERYDNYVQRLQEELEALKETEAESLDQQKKSLETQKKNYKKYLSEKDDLTTKNNKQTRAAMEQNATEMIQDLLSRVAEFGEAGWRAGQQYAREFNKAVAQMQPTLEPNYGYSGDYRAAAGAGVSGANISLYQTFNTPVQTPAQTARDTKDMVERALRI